VSPPSSYPAPKVDITGALVDRALVSECSNTDTGNLKIVVQGDGIVATRVDTCVWWPWFVVFVGIVSRCMKDVMRVQRSSTATFHCVMTHNTRLHPPTHPPMSTEHSSYCRAML